jgi:hypothetical protein
MSALVIVVVGIILFSLMAKSWDDEKKMTPEQRASRAEELARQQASRDNLLRKNQGFASNLDIVCPQCQQKGSVYTRPIKRKAGISGGKATAAVLTGGVSLLATGLSRKEPVTEGQCTHCKSTWHF